MKLKQGLFTGIQEAEYNEIDALRSSDLKYLLKSGAHYRAYKDGLMPPPSPQLQKSYDIGDAVHAATLEPERYKHDFVCMPQFSGKGSKKAKEEWCNEHQGQITLTDEDMRLVNNCAVAIKNHPEASELLSEEGETEMTGIAQMPDSDIWLKIRVDRLNKKRGILINLKTDATDISPEQYVKRSYNLGYHISAGFYVYVMELITGVVHDYYLIVVQKDEPIYPVMVYQFTEEAIMEGQVQAMRAINIYKECMASGEWPGIPGGVHSLGLPGWAKRRNQIIE